MTTNIIFTCPACGSHEIMSIQASRPLHPGTLTVPERAAILAAHHAPAGSVLLVEGRIN